MKAHPEFEVEKALKELVEIYSVTDTPAEQQALDWTALQFYRLGIDYVKIPGSKTGQYAGVVGKIDFGRKLDTAIISNGHIDVVPVDKPWTRTQGDMDGSILYGRGTTDMKAAVIGQIWAAKKARDRGSLSFDHFIQIVAGEETTGWGSERVMNLSKPELRRYQNLAAIIGEPTSVVNADGSPQTLVMNGNKGCFSAEIVVGGDSGHAAESKGKVNSIEVGADIVHALRPLRMEWEDKYSDCGLGSPLLTFTRAEAGVAANSLPPENTFRLDGRFPLELKNRYEKDLREALRGFPVNFRILYSVNPSYTDHKDPWVKVNLRAFNQRIAELPVWATDGCFFTDYEDGVHTSIPVVIAGPGYLDQLHVADENCDTDLIMPWAEKVLAAARAYAELVA